jgi:integrase
MGKTTQRLTAATVKAAGVGLHNDGDGLLLQVLPGKDGGRRRSWLFRFKVGGREQRMGLGPARLPGDTAGVSLAEAREAAETARALLRRGLNPIAERDAEQARQKAETAAAARAAAPVTFAQSFEEFFERKRKELTGVRTARMLRASVQRHVLPFIGQRAVDDITGPDLVAVLKPLWHTKGVTASVLLQRISSVFDLAIFNRQRTSGPNPCVGVRQQLGKQRKAEHFRSMHYSRVPVFLAKLRALDDVWAAGRLCLEWIVLTACRAGEARTARWAEIDTAMWCIPREHTKRRVKHEIPLSGRCLEILDELRRLYPCEPDDFVFPGIYPSAPLTHNTLGTQLLDACGVGETTTVHGLRSSFRVWAAEVARCRPEVGEAALAHGVNDATVDAYLRTSFVSERRPLMDEWARFCSAPPADDKVVRLSQRIAS